MIENIESAVPGLAEIRATESRNRGLAFIGITSSVAGVDVVALTPYHKLALQLVGNGYAVGAEPDKPAAFQLLWLVSTAYARREERGKLATLLARRRIARIVSRYDDAELRAAICAYLRSQTQDYSEVGGSSDSNSCPDYSGSIHPVAAEASFWMNIHGGFTLESYMRTPYLVLQQLRRTWRVNHPRQIQNPDGSWALDWPTFRNDSDRAIGFFHRAQSAKISAEILRQVNRLS